MPDANVLIQIASHGGSRRQEAQVSKNFLYAKVRGVSVGDFSAFFVSFLAPDSH